VSLADARQARAMSFVRQALPKSPGTAWRLLIAHAIAASGYG
jgi:hypothetical protein